MEKADRIYQELLHEQSCIWYISDSTGAKIMIKAPSNVIKAVVKGCKIELLFGRDEIQKPNVFHIGVRIYDDPIHYLNIYGTNRFLDEHYSLARIMNLRKVQVQFYNELNVCQAFGDFFISDKSKHNILCFLKNPRKLYTGGFNEISHSLDRFQYSLDKNMFKESLETISVLVEEGQIKNWSIIDNTFFTDVGIVKSSVTERDEGRLLEKEVYLPLISLFGKNTYLNPKVPDRKGFRELTDILTFSEYGIFLIESKALGVHSASPERSMERKIMGLQKQIEKAIKQLIGASKNITDNMPIYDSGGSLVSFNRAILPHGIILVSEILPFGEWDKTIYDILNSMILNKIWIHLMDLKEFMQFIGYSKNDKNRFDYFLMKRMEAFTKNPQIPFYTKFVDEN